MAEAYMRTSGTAIREMPIAERTPPQTGPVTGRAVAKDEAHIAVATAANSFFVVAVDLSGPRRTNRRTIVSALSAGPCVDRERTRSRKVILGSTFVRGRPCQRAEAFVRLQVSLPTLISAFIALYFLHRSLVLEGRRGLLKRILVTSEPSIPAVLLRNNPAPDEALRGFSQVAFIAQD